jgi:hypothetical protein
MYIELQEQRNIINWINLLRKQRPAKVAGTIQLMKSGKDKKPGSFVIRVYIN